jgi:Bacterial protein of unknown function (Gcw_chp)
LLPFLACRSAAAGMKLRANARPVAYGVDRSRGFAAFRTHKVHAAFGIGWTSDRTEKGQGQMKKVVLSVVAAVAVTATAAPAFAADMAVKAKPMAPAAAPSPWDIAFGGGLMTDYVWRGVTQSGHNPSVTAFFEPRYNINSNWQLYAGVSGESIRFANNAAAEIDFYGGVRPTFGPLALDFGIWEYYYPGGTCWGAGALQAVPGSGGSVSCLAVTWPSGNVAKDDASFYEVYAKATYTMGDWAFGPTFFYSPNFLNTGAEGEYLSGIVTYTAPASMALFNGAVGWYVSGEFGHQWFGTSDPFYGVLTAAGAIGPYSNGIPEPDYNTWNVGLGFTWKVFTLDLRYNDTDLSKEECSAFTSDPGATLGGTSSLINPIGARSNWCGATFVAKLSTSLTLGSLK